ncbi:MAG TPA: FtsX-like permease family protein [Steroidobacteraceae bacterium]|nr:FtsX-like permease family protein [Steroidobacteraceae bacterium]
MELHPVVSALGRNKVGALLIALQMAVTLAILCNALYIVQQRLALIARPSGVDEADVFTLENQWLGQPAQQRGLLQADLAALRAIPGVTDVFESNAVPLNDSSMVLGITLHPDNMKSLLIAATYLGDQNTLRTLGARLVAGRDFTSSDVRDFSFDVLSTPPIDGILVTRALADKLAPGGKVLGRVASIFPFSLQAPIIGIIDRLQAPFVNAPDNQLGSFIENSMVLPYRVLNPSAFYIVRVKPGALASAMRAAPGALAAVSRERVVRQVRSLTQARREIYRADRTIVSMLLIVCAILIAVTAFGIVGLTSYWVSQRRRQIGIRRALGATRLAIVGYFQAENLMISSGGIVLGVGLTVAGNIWMVDRFAMHRLPLDYFLIGIAAMLALGQLAVLWPALRAASVPPVVATRTL